MKISCGDSECIFSEEVHEQKFPAFEIIKSVVTHLNCFLKQVRTHCKIFRHLDERV